MTGIEFIELNQDNWEDCVRLWSDADQFVAANVYSIAEAQFYPKAISRAICDGETMIGYTMYGEDEDDADVWAIDRFMIAQAHRRKGYGLAAFKSIVEIGSSRGFRKFATSTAIKNIPMQQMLAKAGFQTQHEIREGEYIYTFEIKT